MLCYNQKETANAPDDLGLRLFCTMCVLLQIQSLKQLLQITIPEGNGRLERSLVNKRKHLMGWPKCRN